MKTTLVLCGMALAMAACAAPDPMLPGTLTVRAALTQSTAGALGQLRAFARSSTRTQDIELTGVVDWTSSDPSVVSVRTDGQAAFLTPGRALISARLGREVATSELWVSAPPTLEVVPGVATLSAGQRQQFRAVLSSGGVVRDVTPQAVWRFDGSLSATDVAGEAVAVMPGPGTAQATLGALTSLRALGVRAPDMESLRVEFDSPVLRPGLTTSAKLFVRRVDGSEADVSTRAVWSSSDPDVATVEQGSGSLSFQAHGTGFTVVKAQASGLEVSVGLTVEPLRVSTLEVSGGVARLAMGESTRLSVRASMEDGSTQAVTEAQFMADDPAVLSVTPSGLIEAVGLGKAQILTTWRGALAVHEVEVTDARLLELLPSTPALRLAPGQTGELAFSGRYTDGSTRNVGALARVSSAGAVSVRPGPYAVELTGVTTGTEQLVVEVGGRESTLPVEVSAEPLAELVLTLNGDDLAVATARWADGLTMDVTQLAHWKVSPGDPAQVDDVAGTRGHVTYSAAGDVLLLAEFAGTTSSMLIAR